MGYSENSGSVRVDLFRQYGNWAHTIAVVQALADIMKTIIEEKHETL